MKLKTHLLMVMPLFVTSMAYAQFTTTPGNISQTTAGNVGIGTATPVAKLQVTNGSVLYEGTTGATPIAGGGTRMMWIPAKAAFRAGNVTTVNWDDANVGANSFACGLNTKASGPQSFASGAQTVASGLFCFAAGVSSVSSGTYAFACGNTTTASGAGSATFGGFTTAQAYNSFVLGRYNVISGTIASWVNTEPLFIIGNGATALAPNNAMTVLKNGNTGINTATPEDLFQVGNQIAKINMGPATGVALGYGSAYIGFNASHQTGTWSTATDGGNNGGSIIYATTSGDILFSTLPSTGATNRTGILDATVLSSTKLFIARTGEVGINTINCFGSGYKLSVNGAIRAKDIVVSTTWSDFVFDVNYKRMSLLEKEIYYTSQKHLPNIISATEIEKNGLPVGAAMSGMTQNIEENTLDLVELYKKMMTIEKENIELKERLLKLENVKK
jgi:hypothetical protein